MSKDLKNMNDKPEQGIYADKIAVESLIEATMHENEELEKEVDKQVKEIKALKERNEALKERNEALKTVIMDVGGYTHSFTDIMYRTLMGQHGAA
jgi:predicted RNase H-like nuclease (RuvC/YqgF family)